MEQYKPEKWFSSVFYENSRPGILYLYKISGEKTDALRAMHAHPDIVEIMYIQAGRGIYHIGSGHYIVNAGDLIIVNANVLHEEYLGETSLRLYSMGISNLHLKNMAVNTMLKPGKSPILRNSKDSRRCGQLLDMIYQLNADRHAGRDESCYYLLRSLISILCNSEMDSEDSPAGGWEQNTLVESICLYIGSNYEKPITLQMLADTFHMSKYHLSHIFRAQTGISVTDFILHRRIGEAQSKLLETDSPVSQISEAVGFENVGYFNRQFKRIVKMTPMEYRRSSLSHPK